MRKKDQFGIILHGQLVAAIPLLKIHRQLLGYFIIKENLSPYRRRVISFTSSTTANAFAKALRPSTGSELSSPDLYMIFINARIVPEPDFVCFSITSTPIITWFHPSPSIKPGMVLTMFWQIWK